MSHYNFTFEEYLANFNLFCVLLFWGVFMLTLCCVSFCCEIIMAPVSHDVTSINCLVLHIATNTNKSAYREINDTCTICLNKLHFLEDVNILPCTHSFHSACISKWFLIKYMCPVCNLNLSNIIKI